MMVKSMTLPLAPIAAFDLFTQQDRRMVAGRPAPHPGPATARYSCSRAAGSTSGRRDGREVELGVVRRWDPPNRILLDFFIATGPEKPTEVEIAFARAGRARK